MKKLMKKTLFATFAIIIGLVSFCYALAPDSHKEINQHIATNTINGFSLDLYLKDQLGVQEGVDKIINTKKLWQWLRDGGRYEDLPPYFFPPFYLRSVNHFHNPLTEQGFSGFIWGTFLEGMSSTQWALLPEDTQSTLCWLLGCYSWDDVRGYYYTALTSTDQDTRDKNFKKTFRGVGQLMHLIHDASVPAHTRNDFHVFYNYEKWVFNKADIADYNPVGFSGAIDDIASFIDTNQYNGANPNIAVGAAIGLSEYTNANFFSNNTINATNFPYPQTEGMPMVERNFTNTFWSTTYLRRYYLKDCCGETNGGQGYLLAAVDRLDYYREQYPLLSFALPEISVLDNEVYSDYASLLIPRAVGYSAGLLNYFFRGTLEITPPNQVAYSVTDGSQTPYNDNGNLHQQFTHIKAKVQNTTPKDVDIDGNPLTYEQIGPGTLVAVAKYKIIPDYIYDLSNYPPDETTMQDTEYSYSVSAEKVLTQAEIDSLNASEPTAEFIFVFSSNPITVELDALLQAKWEAMKTALGNQDINGGLALFLSSSQERYENIFTTLFDSLPDIANMQSIELIYIEEGVAQYRIKRTEAEGEITYYIYFELDENGIWGIKQF